MRELNIGGKAVRVRATPLALLFYKQEFKSDLLGGMVQMEKTAKDPTQIDTVFLLQLTWAMAKAEAGASAKFPSFVTWLEELEYFDLSDPSVMTGIMEEAKDGFFRSRAPVARTKTGTGTTRRKK